MQKRGGEIWNWRRADAVFSDYIRHRDGWRCRYCGKDLAKNTGQLQNSHFWSRKRYSTRFDPENCISLCVYCHHWKLETEKQGEYRRLMLELLGQEKYDALEVRANTITTRNKAVEKFMEWIRPYLPDIQTPKKSRWPLKFQEVVILGKSHPNYVE